MYRAGIESILGLRQRGARLAVDPCIPSAWPGFEATLRQGSTRYHVIVENRSRSSGRISHAELDGKAVVSTLEGIDVPLDGGEHQLRVIV
jgi:cyclic beta-1,2-glucan synthetase